MSCDYLVPAVPGAQKYHCPLSSLHMSTLFTPKNLPTNSLVLPKEVRSGFLSVATIRVETNTPKEFAWLRELCSGLFVFLSPFLLSLYALE